MGEGVTKTVITKEDIKHYAKSAPIHEVRMAMEIVAVILEIRDTQTEPIAKKGRPRGSKNVKTRAVARLQPEEQVQAAELSI